MSTTHDLDTPMNPGNKRTRLMIDISPDLRRRIKVAAAENDQTVRDYVENILERSVPTTPATDRSAWKPIDPLAVEALRELREQIAREHPGVVFEDSAEVIRRMREERDEELERAWRKS